MISENETSSTFKTIQDEDPFPLRDLLKYKTLKIKTIKSVI